MVFVNTRKNADFLCNNLKRYRLNAVAIHGGLEQNKRNNIMKMFHSNEVFILVCTDVAARGLDIKNVSHVYNYDIPMNSKEYVHRIGRTARAGKDGIAINIVSPRDYDNFRSVMRNPDLKITNEPLPEVEKIFVNFHSDEGRGGGGRGRGFGGRGGDFRGRGNMGGRGRGYARDISGSSERKESSEPQGEGRGFGGRPGSGGAGGGRAYGGKSFGGERKSYGRPGGGKRFNSSGGRRVGGYGGRRSAHTRKRSF
jgi:superfamily II DNA/RNA helicase